MGTHLKNPGVWVYGLASAFIGGAVTILVAWGVDNAADFHFLIELKKAAIVGGMFAGAYLKKSPLPEIVTTDTEIIRKPE